MRIIICILGVVLLTFATDPVWAAEPPYDLVIRTGKVVDGSGNPWFQRDVAIRGDRVVAVGRVGTVPGKREIDGKTVLFMCVPADAAAAPRRCWPSFGPRSSSREVRPRPGVGVGDMHNQTLFGGHVIPVWYAHFHVLRDRT